MTKSAETVDLVIFTKEHCNGKFDFFVQCFSHPEEDFFYRIIALETPKFQVKKMEWSPLSIKLDFQTKAFSENALPHNSSPTIL